jgi:hypothetical protein
MPVLRVKSGPHKGHVHDILADSLVLGRESAGDVQVLDQGVSRRHAEIFRIGEMYFIRDLESRNGTFVNDKPIQEEILRVGDQIRLGNTSLVFEDRVAALKESSRINLEGASADELFQPTSTIQFRKETSVAQPKTEQPVSPESRDLNLLFLIGHIMSEEKDLSRLLTRIAQATGKCLTADHLYVLWRREGETSAFEILGRYDREESEQAQGLAGVSRGIIKDCLKYGRSVLTSDASLDGQFDGMASVVMNQLRSVICVPISVLGSHLGVLYVYSRRPEAFCADDLELASTVGIQLGTTVALLKSLRSSERFFRNSIKTLVSAVEMRLPDTRGRCERVATYCLAIAKELGLDTHGLRTAWLAGMLHNIGLVAMSDKEREQEITLQTKKNSFARKLLSHVPDLKEVLPAIENQDERFDGSGAPEGKKGAEIPVLARVLGLALELDRLLSEGASEGGESSLKDVFLKLKEMADRQFDRESVNALLIAYRNAKLFSQDEEFFEVPL